MGTHADDATSIAAIRFSISGARTTNVVVGPDVVLRRLPPVLLPDRCGAVVAQVVEHADKGRRYRPDLGGRPCLRRSEWCVRRQAEDRLGPHENAGDGSTNDPDNAAPNNADDGSTNDPDDAATYNGTDGAAHNGAARAR
jgi:hypothetical protein